MPPPLLLSLSSSSFLSLSPSPHSTEAGAFLFCDFLVYCPRGEKKFAPFLYVLFFWGFTALLLVYLNMLWMQLSVCIAETQSLSCFIYFLYNEPKFSLAKKSDMSYSPDVMYSVCKLDISETSKSEPVHAILAIISLEHTQQRIWKKLATLAHCRVLYVAFRTFITNSLNKWWISAYFILPFTNCGIIFLYLKRPA